MTADVTGSIDQYRYAARRRSRAWAITVVAASAAVCILLLRYPPGWPALLLCVGAAFLVGTWYRPLFGVASILGLTLVFEQYDFARFRPITRLVPLFENASRITGIRGLEISPLELLLVAVTVILLVQIVTKRTRVRENPLALPVLTFLMALSLWLLYGLVAGGELNVALWELRGLAYFGLLLFVVPQVLSAERDVRMLMWVAIVAIIAKSIQGAWNYFVVLGGDLSSVRSITSHEDALFIAFMGVFLIAMLFYRTGSAQRVVLLTASPVLGLTFVLTDRRAAFVAFAIGLLVLASLIASDAAKRSLLLKTGLPLLVAFALVVVAGWNSSGILGLPAQTIKSISAPENKEDADSSYYRRAEEVNLIHAVESNPIIGLGFGRPFQQPGQGGIVDIGFTLENVIPHNEIIWIWAKMGTIGFGLFWVMIGSVIAFGGLMFRSADAPYIKVVAGFVTSAVAMQIVVSYVDLQLTYARNMVLLGVLVGVLAWLPRLIEGEAADVS